MPKIGTVFAELLKLLPRFKFETSVSVHKADRYTKRFNSWRQLTTLLYAQISRKESLREIETGLSAHGERLYHLGLKNVRRSTLADANNRRPYEIFESLFYSLYERCRSLTPKHKFKFKNPLYSLDATTIDLCLSMFPWAKFQHKKGAVKIHCLYDHSGALPSFMVITDGKRYETTVAREHKLPLSPDSILSVDRGYMDLIWLYSLTKNGVYFVTRAKSNFNCRVVGQHNAPAGKGVVKDEIVSLVGKISLSRYADNLRRIEFFDEEHDKTLVFITNNFTLTANAIAAIYKARWQIELFFKWVKQNLKIKSFLGTSKNAVMSQIWVAMCCYLLLAYIKYQTKYRNSLLELSRVVRETLMDRKSLIDILTLSPQKLCKVETEPIQASLF